MYFKKSIFYDKVFKHINEQDFKDLYDPIYGRVNFPTNILVALEIVKEMHSLTDEQLYESYHFNYLYQKAVGVGNINQFSFSIRTLYNFRKNYCEHEKRTGINLFDQVFKDGRDKMCEESRDYNFRGIRFHHFARRRWLLLSFA
jgi:hypothetical protein